MKAVFKIAILTAVMLSLFGSAWVSYSAEKQCPTFVPKPMSDQEFMSAHGLTQKNMSLWMKEHSIKRTTKAEELKACTVTPAPAAKGK